MEDRLKIVIGAHLILRDQDKVLLMRRFNTGYADGYYNFPCGHLDPDENVKSALVREAEEETGVLIQEDDLKFTGCTHWRSNKQSVNLFFQCSKWTGTPVNGEPDKCDHIEWFKAGGFPEKLVLQTRSVLNFFPFENEPFFIEMEDRP